MVFVPSSLLNLAIKMYAKREFFGIPDKEFPTGYVKSSGAVL